MTRHTLTRAKGRAVSHWLSPGDRRETPQLAAFDLPTRRLSLAAAIKPVKKTAALKPVSGKREPATAVPTARSLPETLAEAHARIRALEARLDEVTNRIAWVSDRLHSLLEDTA